MKKLRIFLLGLILAAAVIPAVNSQSSIILESTFGLFEDDVDNFLDVNDYGYVEFDNAFIYLKGSDRNADGVRTTADGAFDSEATGKVNENQAGIQGGIGTRFGSLYLGLGFDTKLWSGTETTVEIDGKRDDPVNSFSDPSEPGIGFDGSFGILLGTGNIGGFKLSLDFDNVSLNTDKNDITPPDEVSYSDGKLGIDLGWGKNFDLKGGILSPEFHIGYQISTFKIEQKNPDGFTYVAYPDSNIPDNPRQIFEKMSHLRVNPFAEYLSPTETHWFAVSYTLDIGIHPQTIHKDPGSEGSIDWKGYQVGNALSGGYVGGVDLSDRFVLAFGGNLGLELLNSKADYTDIPDPVEYIDFSVNPNIEIGVTYDFAKKPFQLYSALMFSSLDDPDTPEEERFYTLSYAKDEAPDTEVYSHAFTPWGLSAGLGLKFTPFSKFALDLGLSQNLSYYISDKLEYVWAWNILDWSNHPFTASLQATIKF
jgi:hypothetical protein